MLLARSRAGTGSNVVTKTAGETLAAGDVLSLNTSGDVVKASSVTSLGLYEVFGIALQAATATNPVNVTVSDGSEPSVRFATPPAAADNGSMVFLSATSGLASLVPDLGGGRARVLVGLLAGADGATSAPTVQFRPQFLALKV